MRKKINCLPQTFIKLWTSCQKQFVTTFIWLLLVQLVSWLTNYATMILYTTTKKSACLKWIMEKDTFHQKAMYEFMTWDNIGRTQHLLMTILKKPFCWEKESTAKNIITFGVISNQSLCYLMSFITTINSLS